MLQDISKKNLHHTSICIGRKEVVLADVDDFLAREFPTEPAMQTGDIIKVEKLVYEFDKFLIEDARHIFSIHLHKKSHDTYQFIVIVFNSATTESQNSLLKMLEEPKRNTYFFIVVPSAKQILPTVLSRAQVFTYVHDVVVDEETFEFIQAPIKDRLEQVKKMVEDIKSEKKTKQDLINFLEEIEKFHHTNGASPIKLRRIIEIKDYLKEQGASVKQLLEYVALEV